MAVPITSVSGRSCKSDGVNPVDTPRICAHAVIEGRTDGCDFFAEFVGRLAQSIEPQLREGDQLQGAGAQFLFNAAQIFFVDFQDAAVGAADPLAKQLVLHLLARQFTDLPLQASR